MVIECNKENMRVVVAALRTDRFKQGQGNLAQKHDGQWLHCCLGVACEIAIESGVVLGVQERTSTITRKLFGGSGGHLPVEVQRWLGVRNDNLSVKDEHGYTDAVSANDSDGWSFEMIADGLEKAYGLLEGGDGTTGIH
jgi:hypothetical protein